MIEQNRATRSGGRSYELLSAGCMPGAALHSTCSLTETERISHSEFSNAAVGLRLGGQLKTDKCHEIQNHCFCRGLDRKLIRRLGTKQSRAMSALGQKRTFSEVYVTSESRHRLSALGGPLMTQSGHFGAPAVRLMSAIGSEGR